MTITYDVTIDADATAAVQTNVAKICVSELPTCGTVDEHVTPQFPGISIVKTAGDAADGEVFATEPGNVTYTYVVTNTGPLPLHAVVVTDDAGTPAGDQRRLHGHVPEDDARADRVDDLHRDRDGHGRHDQRRRRQRPHRRGQSGPGGR